MKKIVVFLLLIVISTTMVFAQGSQEPKQAKKFDLVLGTAGTSGTYYVVAAAMAQAINNNSERLNVIAQPTKGSIENLNLAHTGAIHMGMSNADGVYWATTGTGMYASTGSLNIRGVMSLYMSAGQMVTMQASGIKTYADLRGKKVCLGPPGQTVVEMSKAILRAYGIDPEKDITPYYLAIDEGLGKLKDGEIDATFWVAGVPTAGLINAATTSNISFVEVSDEVLQKVATENPYYSRYVIPANTYRGQTNDVNTLKIMTEIFANKDVPDDIIYEFVKLALETQPQYADAHLVIREITPQNAAAIVSELHPGALRYFKEIGLR